MENMEERVRGLEARVLSQHASLSILQSAVVLASRNVLTVENIHDLGEAVISRLLQTQCPDAAIEGVTEATQRLIETIKQISV